MRLCQPLTKKYPSKYKMQDNAPFQELLPLNLKNAISGKGDKTSDVACIQEMTLLFACLKSNEFNQIPCTTEIQTFKKCYTNYMETKAAKRADEKKGLLNPGERRMTHKQVNQLLKQYPS